MLQVRKVFVSLYHNTNPMDKIKAILIEPLERKVSNIEIEPSLVGYYSALNCNLVEFSYMADCPFEITLIIDG